MSGYTYVVSRLKFGLFCWYRWMLKFSFKNAIFEAEVSTILRKFLGKMKIVRKLQLAGAFTMLTHHAADNDV